MTGIEFEYWDSCIFLALLQNEEHRPGELEYLQDQAQKFDMGVVGIVTSSIAMVEVYEARLSSEQAVRIKSMYSRSNFQFIDASLNVCMLASEIRSFYKLNTVNTNGVELYPSTPDAIHVASAIVAQKGLPKPLSLITFDSENKSKKNELALTGLTGKVAEKYPLTICRPPVNQLKLAI